MHLAAHRQHRVLGDRLDAGGHVHVALLNGRLGIARRRAEQPIEPAVGHRQALAIVEVLHVEPEAPIGLEIDQMFRDEVFVDGPAVGRQSHQLVFAAVDLEPAVVRHGRIQQAERMRELDLLREFDLVATAHAKRRRAPLADAVERENRRLVEGARKESAGRVTFVVVGEDDRRVDVTAQVLPDDSG